MNVSQDLHATRRRAALRDYAKWADQQHVREQKERGSPLPAWIALAMFCAGVWAGLIWMAK